MSYFAVRYTYTGDTAARDALRPSHREHLRSLASNGFIVASGPLPGSDPAAALLLVRAEDEDAVREGLAEDPFLRAGLVERLDAERWDPVIGVPWGS